MLENLGNELLPYAGIGAGSAIPFLVYRVMYLEKQVKNQEKAIKNLKKETSIYYFYLTKKDTNFSNFIQKHEKHFER